MLMTYFVELSISSPPTRDDLTNSCAYGTGGLGHHHRSHPPFPEIIGHTVATTLR